MKISSSDVIERYITRDRLDRYLDEVEKANRNFNLYSRRLTRTDLRVFVAESLVPVESGWISGAPAKLIDIGSGWGIPAVPLLLAGLPIDITMAERSQKKADFLFLLLRRLEIEAKIICGDITAPTSDESFDIVTVRGVAVNHELAENIERVSGADAHIVYFGPDFPRDIFDDSQYVDYEIDDFPARRLWKAKISLKF